MKHKAFKLTLAVSIIIISLFPWWSIHRAATDPESSQWLSPIILFSILFIFISLGSVIIKNRTLLFSVFALTLAGSLVFSFSLIQIAAILFSFLLLAAGALRVQSDLQMVKKIRITRSLRLGKSIFVIALSLVITSQFYMTVKDDGMERILNQLNFSKISSKVTPQILSAMNPQFRGLEDEKLTVDEFTLKMQEDQMEKMGTEMISEIENVMMTPQQEEEMQAMVLEEGRRQFSEIAGREVKGDEPVSGIFSGMIDKKIDDYFRIGSNSQEMLPILPFILAVVLFLTVASIGSILAILLVYIAHGLFLLFVKLKLVTIVKVPAEVEMIE